MHVHAATARRLAVDRLDSAVASPEGWNIAGDARRVTAAAAQFGRLLLDAVELERAPWIGPMPDGGLQLIWIIDGREAQADVFPEGDEVLIFGGAPDPTERPATDVDGIAREIESILRGPR